MAMYQGHIDGYLTTDRPGREVVPLAVYYRFLRRIAANLLGVVRQSGQSVAYIEAPNVDLSTDEIKDLIRETINRTLPGERFDIPEDSDGGSTGATKERSAPAPTPAPAPQRQQPDAGKADVPANESREDMKRRHKREKEDPERDFKRAKEDLEMRHKDERRSAGDDDDDDHPGRGRGKGRGRGRGRDRD